MIFGKKEEPKTKSVFQMTAEERYKHVRDQHDKNKKEKVKTNG